MSTYGVKSVGRVWSKRMVWNRLMSEVIRVQWSIRSKRLLMDRVAVANLLSPISSPIRSAGASLGFHHLRLLGQRTE